MTQGKNTLENILGKSNQHFFKPFSEQISSFELYLICSLQVLWIWMIVEFFASNPFPKQTRFFMILKKKPFENIVGKGENAGNHHSLLFQQCFQRAFFWGSFNGINLVEFQNFVW